MLISGKFDTRDPINIPTHDACMNLVVLVNVNDLECKVAFGRD